MDGKFLRCWGPKRAGLAKGGLRAASGARLGTPEGQKELGTGGTRGNSFKQIVSSTSMVLKAKKPVFVHTKTLYNYVARARSRVREGSLQK